MWENEDNKVESGDSEDPKPSRKIHNKESAIKYTTVYSAVCQDGYVCPRSLNNSKLKDIVLLIIGVGLS